MKPMTAKALVKVFGLLFDLLVVSGTVWLIGWHGWSAWWMVLAIIICHGSWSLKSSAEELLILKKEEEEDE